MEALLLLPSLVLGPEKPGASSSRVKIEVSAKLDLWRRGLLDGLALRDKVQASAHPFA